jgi:hypothetical protein
MLGFSFKEHNISETGSLPLSCERMKTSLCCVHYMELFSFVGSVRRVADLMHLEGRSAVTGTRNGAFVTT